MMLIHLHHDFTTRIFDQNSCESSGSEPRSYYFKVTLHPSTRSYVALKASGYDYVDKMSSGTKHLQVVSGT